MQNFLGGETYVIFSSYFRVQRSRGTFGNVTVNWEILSNGRTALQDNGEFVQARGGLVFRQGSTSEVLSVTVRSDGVPELNETFYVRLINATGRHLCKCVLECTRFS